MAQKISATSLANAIFKRTQKITSNDLETSQQLITKLLEEVKTFRNKAEDYIAKRNMDELAKLFHKLAGLAGYFGATQLFDHNVKLEELAKQNIWDELEPHLDSFRTETDKLLAAEEKLNKLLKL